MSVKGVRQKRRNLEFPVHDLFDGSDHCRECGGPCKLEGAEYAVSSIVRVIFETIAARDRVLPTYKMRQCLGQYGVDFESYLNRALSRTPHDVREAHTVLVVAPPAKESTT